MRGDAFEATPVPELPAGVGRLVGIVRTVEGALQAEHGRGIIELRENAWVEVAPQVAEWLAGADAVAAVARLPDGGRILSCNAGPLLLLGADGRVKGKAGEAQGLNERGIHRVALDHDGGLWLASAGGVARVQVDGAMTRYGRAQGLPGGPRDLTLGADGELWVATSTGWFLRAPRTGRFEERGAYDDLFSAGRSPDGGWILAGSGQPLRHWTERGAEPVLAGAQPGFVSLATNPRDGTRIFGGTQNAVLGLRRLQPDGGGWPVSGQRAERPRSSPRFARRFCAVERRADAGADRWIAARAGIVAQRNPGAVDLCDDGRSVHVWSCGVATP